MKYSNWRRGDIGQMTQSYIKQQQNNQNKYVHTRMILPELTLAMSYFLIHVYQNAIYLCEMGIHVP
jgi:hypothetical protein